MVIDKFRIQDKKVVITGGSGLLGRKHAEAVIEAGGIPILVDINPERTETAARELRSKYGTEVIAYLSDITDANAVKKMSEDLIAKLGRIDILINNAALDPKVKAGSDGKSLIRFENYPPDVWDAELAVGLKGAYLCARFFGSHMAQAGGGVILNISSDLGVIAPDQRLYRKEGLPDNEQSVKPVTYSVIKHGLIGLTKYIATYWADKGVRSNALCPGGVYNLQPDDFVERLSNLIPMGRMADRDEYKAAVVFLISDASSYMTGSTIIMDGGRTCW